MSGGPVNPQTAQGLTYNAWTPTGWATLSAGTTSSNVALGSTQIAPNTSFVALVYNGGSQAANVIIGTDNTIAATLTSGTLVLPGACIALNASNGEYIAGITASSTAALTIITGYGSPGAEGIGSPSSSGAVTQGTTPWVDNISQWAGVALGAPSNYGTSPGAVEVPGVNAFVTNAPTVVPAPAQQTPTVSASGAVNSLVLLASATTVGMKYAHAENLTNTVGYMVVYNGTAAPSTGALTAANVLAFQLLPANGYADMRFDETPLAGSAGIVVLLTSAATPFTYTTGVITGAIYGKAS